MKDDRQKPSSSNVWRYHEQLPATPASLLLPIHRRAPNCYPASRLSRSSWCNTQAAFNNILTSAFAAWRLVIGVLLQVGFSEIRSRPNPEHDRISGQTNQPTSAHSFIYCGARTKPTIGDSFCEQQAERLSGQASASDRGRRWHR